MTNANEFCIFLVVDKLISERIDMSTFLGIRYNRWHMILAASLFLLIYFAFALYFHYPQFALFYVTLTIADGLFVWLIGVHYEYHQAVDYNEVFLNHGGWQAFVEDSKDDLRNNLFGIIVGVFIGNLSIIFS